MPFTVVGIGYSGDPSDGFKAIVYDFEVAERFARDLVNCGGYLFAFVQGEQADQGYNSHYPQLTETVEELHALFQLSYREFSEKLGLALLDEARRLEADIRWFYYDCWKRREAASSLTREVQLSKSAVLKQTGVRPCRVCECIRRLLLQLSV